MGGKHVKGSPSQANVVRGSMQNPGLLKSLLPNRSPKEANRATLAQKPHAIPYCPSVKGNIQFPGKPGISPKVASTGQAFHKFRSPSYTEQNAIALKNKSVKKNTGQILAKS